MTAFDAFYHLALIVTLRGTPLVIDYYTQLLEKMKNRVARGIGAIPNEKYRLLWDIPDLASDALALGKAGCTQRLPRRGYLYLRLVRHDEVHRRK